MTLMTDSLIVNKLNLNHELVIAYDGAVLERTPEAIVLEARFSRETMDLGYAVLEHHDRFVEHFYADRWYNIFEIHSVHDDHLKGWYCNIVKPAVFSADAIEQVDLALDRMDQPRRLVSGPRSRGIRSASDRPDDASARAASRGRVDLFVVSPRCAVHGHRPTARAVKPRQKPGFSV